MQHMVITIMCRSELSVRDILLQTCARVWVGFWYKTATVYTYKCSVQPSHKVTDAPRILYKNLSKCHNKNNVNVICTPANDNWQIITRCLNLAQLSTRALQECRYTSASVHLALVTQP